MAEVIEDGAQFPLPGDFQSLQPPSTDSPAAAEKKVLERKRGSLLRILQTKSDRELLKNKALIEEGFKAGSDRLFRYPYETSKGRQYVDASPEDIQAVIEMRQRSRIQAIRK